jgi:hypothetical protein
MWVRRHDEYDASAEAEAATASSIAEQVERYRSAHPENR